jgi:hypothetical protein
MTAKDYHYAQEDVDIYSVHNWRGRHGKEKEMIRCLKKVLKLVLGRKPTQDEVNDIVFGTGY